MSTHRESIELGIDFDGMYTTFRRDAEIHASAIVRNVQEGFDNVQGMVVALNIMLNSLTSTQKLEEMREFVGTLAAKLATENRRRQAMQEWVVGDDVEVHADGRVGKVDSVRARSNGEDVQVVVDVCFSDGIGTFDAAELTHYPS
jgi:hypothetical protein